MGPLAGPATVPGTRRDAAGTPAGGRTGDAPAAGLGWRTRVTFAVRGDGVAGLRAHRSHEVINVADCLIAHPRIRDLGIPARRWPQLATLEAVVATDNGERAVIASGASRSVPLTQITAESVLAAGRHHRPGGTVLRGHAHLRQRAAGRSWRVSAGGFWQVHPAAASTLAGAVLDALRPRPGDAVLDLYCGAGLFAGVLADAVGPGGTVAGVEASTAAVRDARRNLRPMPWAAVYQGDAGEVIARGVLPPARLAVLDPPRAGAARDVIDYLATGSGPAGPWTAPGRLPGTAPGTAPWTVPARTVNGVSRTFPATPPRSPATSPFSPGTAGGWRRCARSTPSP